MCYNEDLWKGENEKKKEKGSKKIAALFCLILILITAEAILMIASLPEPLGWDFDKYHITAAQNYISSNYTYLSLYPPIFHILLVPFVYTNTYIYLQPALLLILVSVLLYFSYRMDGSNAMIITGFLLFSSIAFMWYYIALSPQLLDMIIFPLTALAFFSDKYLLASIGLIALFYNHVFGIFFFLVIFMYALIFKRDFIKYSLAAFIAGIPPMSISAYPAFMSLFQSNIINIITTQNNYDPIFWSNIPNFIVWSGSYMWFVLPLVIYSMYKFKSFQKKHVFYFLWVAVFLIGMYVAFSRWIPLFIVPFILFEGSMISKFTEVKA